MALRFTSRNGATIAERSAGRKFDAGKAYSGRRKSIESFIELKISRDAGRGKKWVLLVTYQQV
jgi:hypothetical protein